MKERVSCNECRSQYGSGWYPSKASAIEQAEAQAEAMKAQGSAAKTGGIMSAIGGIATAAIGCCLTKTPSTRLMQSRTHVKSCVNCVL